MTEKEREMLEEDSVVRSEEEGLPFPTETLFQENLTGILKASAKETFSRVGWAYFAFLFVGILTQLTVGAIIGGISEGLNFSIQDPLLKEFVDYFLTLIPMYLVGVPLLNSLLKKLPKEEIKGESFSVFRFLKFFVISLPIMYLGNAVSLLFAGLFEKMSGKTAVNNISELIGNSNPWMLILFVVIIGPIMEEVVFRKLLLDRTVQFGEKNAVVLSAIMFGLFHMNFFQFFYATALGLIFGYMYIKSGKLRYTILLHMVINFMGSVVAVFLGGGEGDSGILKLIQDGHIDQVPADHMLQLILLSAYSIFVVLASIVGIILIILNFRKISFDPAGLRLEKRVVRGLTYGNLGIAFFFALCIVMMVATTLMQLQ